MLVCLIFAAQNRHMKQKPILLTLALLIGLFSNAQLKVHASGNPPMHPVAISVFPFGQSLFSSYPFDLPGEGKITGETSNGAHFTGTVKRGKLNGAWQSHYANGKLMDEGQLIKGIPNGEWKVWNSAGQLIAVRTYSADLFHRIKREVSLNHPKQTSYALTARYKKEGRDAVKFLHAGSSFIQQRKMRTNDLQELVSANNSDPEHYHPAFNECLHHGLYMNFFDNGVTKDSGYYKNGLRDAVWMHRTSDGVWQGAYKNGVRISQWKLYNEAGKLRLIIFYNQNGKEEGRKKMG